MSEITKIQWCDSTWNPWQGCSPLSAGCQNCYAKNLVNRFGGDFTKRVRSAPATFNAPLKWNGKPWVCDLCGNAFADSNGECGCTGMLHRRRIFALSLGDWLDPEVPVEWLADTLDIIRRCPGCDFLLLTKRPELWEERLTAVQDEFSHSGMITAETVDWVQAWQNQCPPSNIWLGVTVENQAMADKRIPELLKIPARVRFLSCEPLLTSVNLNGPTFGEWITAIDWVIVGCESGPQRRNQEQYAEHARSINEQCRTARVPVFNKQMPIGGVPYKKNSRVSHNPQEWPADLRAQEFPR